MALEPGTHLGPYEILAPLGAGGMGEVYRAKDSRLDREVAIKVLPDAFARDSERVARFQREAKLLASLNHPNIAAIHGFEESDATRFLVLELVEGETLAARLKVGPLPVDEALDVSRQVAEALEAAHEHGVIHRDLKPGNVKVTPEGKVKVLDFGLAKAFASETSVTDIAHSPTITADHTQKGVVLGTATYMSPEQARGKPLDKRTDIWSFGCVLYECLTGRRPFEGETASDIVARILERDPDYEALPAKTPLAVRNLLRHCLEKDRKGRLRDIGDARLELEEAVSTRAWSTASMAAATAVPRYERRRMWLAAAAVALFALGAVLGALVWDATRSPSASEPTRGIVRLAITLPESAPLSVRVSRPIAISPDGQTVVYASMSNGKPRLYMRSLDDMNPTPIPGTENGFDPFFSPDGRSIGFLDAESSRLKRLVLGGVAATTLSDGSAFVGAVWGADGYIYYTAFGEAPVGSSVGISRVPAGGGSPETVTTPDPQEASVMHFWPDVLPDAKTLLFTIVENLQLSRGQVVALRLETGEQKPLIENAVYARYATAGYLAHLQGNTLLAAAFDPERLEITSSAVVVLDGFMSNPESGSAAFAFSQGGTLAYAPETGPIGQCSILLADRDGTTEPLTDAVDNYLAGALSPDGQKLAVAISSGVVAADIWIYDRARQTFDKLTDGGWNDGPVWSADGQHVVYGSLAAPGGFTLTRTKADGSGEPEPLTEADDWLQPRCFSPDGSVLMFSQLSLDTKGDLYLLRMDGERTPEPLLQSAADEADARISPDGRWVAYTTDRLGQDEVFVRAFPGPARAWRVSTDGGNKPFWSRDGKELFYLRGNDVMAVSISSEPQFSPGTRQRLFSLPERKTYSPIAESVPYIDATPNGRFVVILQSEGQSAPTQINMVLNWFAELKRRVPTETARQH